MRISVTSEGGKAERECEGAGAGVGWAEGWAVGRPWMTGKVLGGGEGRGCCELCQPHVANALLLVGRAGAVLPAL